MKRHYDLIRLLKHLFYKRYRNSKGSFRYYGEMVYFPKDSSTFNMAMQDGIYEHDILKFPLNLIKPDSLYIDIGANIGLMSVPLLKNNSSVKVLSLEASPNTFNYLQRTWSGSKYKDRWKVLHKAVSDQNGEVEFFISAGSDGAFESMRDTGRVTYSGKVKVPAITIDELWRSEGKPAVSFIKSDIEGADLLALKGAKECISICRPYIMLEWNPVNIRAFEYSHSDLLQFCTMHSYACYAIPSLTRIHNETELKLHAILTENFLLAPDDGK